METNKSGDNVSTTDDHVESTVDDNKSIQVATDKQDDIDNGKKQSKQRISSGGGNNKGRRLTKGSSNSINSNGDGYGAEYDDDFDMEEPFSESDDDTESKAKLAIASRRLNLPIARGRVRSLSGTVPIVGYSPKWGGATMCLSCLQFFELPNMVDAFTKHLLVEHHIVVAEIELIVDLKRYIEYWRQIFAKTDIAEIFPKVVPQDGDPYYEKIDYYYLMSEQLKDDYALRHRLALRRLEEALACQQREREDSTFSQQCIFCRYVARDLNLGSPDNLVFVTEYIEHLKSKLNRNECIYCEKVFNDRIELMDHMRKRQHREVNPKNNYYDKFYIINYLELGKKWLEVLAEDFEDTTPTFMDSDEEEEEESWHEWQEDNLDEDQTRIVCLFCDHSFDQAQQLLDHIQETHNWDMLAYIIKEELDVYGRIKMINYIRKQTYDAVCFVCGKDDLGSWPALRKHLAENNHLSKGLPDRSVWDTEEYLVPMFGNDHLLWMLESYLDEHHHGDNDEMTILSTDIDQLNVDSTNTALLNEKLVDINKAATVHGVVAEQLPMLTETVLNDADLVESLK